jgi:hypothetical protein
VGATTKSTFGSKLLGGSCKKRHCHKPWFNTDCHIAKNAEALVESQTLICTPLNTRKVNLKKIRKENNFLGNCKNSTYVCACQGGCAFILEKVSTKVTCRGQD